jgi:ribosomal protein S16
MDQARSITVDGISYDVAQFSPEIQQAVGIYNTFAADLQKAQLDVIKCQAALQSVGAQISTAVKAELEKKAADAKAAAEGEKAE